MDQKKVGSFLKELRKEKGVTQEQLAEKLNVSGRSVSRWETGSNMPDISLLVEIADYYDVDVREIIEGERKSEMMDKEVRDVANKMADYAQNEKGRLFTIVRLIGIIGVIVLAIAIIFQCTNYNPEPSFGTFAAVALSVVAFVAMMVLTLYVNGILQKIKKNKFITVGLIVLMSVLTLVIIRFLITFGLLMMVILIEMLSPTKKGVEYDKTTMISEYSSEMNSDFLLFPDDLSKSVNDEFAYSAKTGLFDTDGYFILKVQYNEEDYKDEADRLAGTYNDVTIGDGTTYTQNVYYDDTTYNYPAYVAMDGYDSAYEYALLDEENDTIIYVSLSYPENLHLSKYKDYLKKDAKAYFISSSSLERFSIYSHYDPAIDGWVSN
ncbi:MAG: helix-turn-helix domain-containing protein [Lachnospiraceae bacterium]|nr:helix-turn-helix domain-containing protein [Lachnospiraceae bacterium]